ncbi:MAG TPA: hypothetical protein DDW49_10735 [Deltaproteobacteria bacterium]|nr:MAG: hypothetical protein A2048_07055 [Deltaproteobacteria bacterium GWA2_45_12]HBF13839.1 hypothetical protein [Deltaproteobacteria bacterium]
MISEISLPGFALWDWPLPQEGQEELTLDGILDQWMEMHSPVGDNGSRRRENGDGIEGTIAEDTGSVRRREEERIKEEKEKARRNTGRTIADVGDVSVYDLAPNFSSDVLVPMEPASPLPSPSKIGSTPLHGPSRGAHLARHGLFIGRPVSWRSSLAFSSARTFLARR